MQPDSQVLIEKSHSANNFLNRVWSVALYRPIDEDARRDWLYKLDRGISRLTIIEDLLVSAEYGLQAKDNFEFARDLYRLILDREPESDEGVNAWGGFAQIHGRRAAFQTFCTAEEVSLKYSNEDSFDLVEGAAGVIRVCFRRLDAQLTLGNHRARMPLVVNGDNQATVDKFLTLAGFEILAVRIGRHLATAEPAAWSS